MGNKSKRGPRPRPPAPPPLGGNRSIVSWTGAARSGELDRYFLNLDRLARACYRAGKLELELEGDTAGTGGTRELEGEAAADVAAHLLMSGIDVDGAAAVFAERYGVTLEAFRGRSAGEELEHQEEHQEERLEAEIEEELAAERREEELEASGPRAELTREEHEHRIELLERSRHLLRDMIEAERDRALLNLYEGRAVDVEQSIAYHRAILEGKRGLAEKLAIGLRLRLGLNIEEEEHRAIAAIAARYRNLAGYAAETDKQTGRGLLEELLAGRAACGVYAGKVARGEAIGSAWCHIGEDMGEAFCAVCPFLMIEEGASSSSPAEASSSSSSPAEEPAP